MKSPRDKSNHKGPTVIYPNTTAVLLKRTLEEKAQLKFNKIMPFHMYEREKKEQAIMYP